MKVAVLCSYPPHHVTGESFPGSRKTHVSSWNVTLIRAMAETGRCELFVISNGGLKRTRRFHRDGITFIYVRRTPFLDHWFPELRRRRFQRILKKLQPDLVHGIGNEHLYPWMAMLSGFPYLATLHGLLYRLIKEPDRRDTIRLRLEQKVFKNCASFIVVYREIEQAILDARPQNPPALFRIPNAINPEFFLTGNSERTLDIAMVGMLQPLKNQHLLIPIVKLLVREFPDLKCEIVGGTSPLNRAYMKQITVEITRNGLSSNIRLSGQLSASETAELLSRSRILLHLSDYETGPMVAMEAAAAGAVPVVRAVGGAPDLIESGADGVLLNDISPEVVASQLSALLRDETARSRMAQEASTRVRNVNHPSEVANSTIDAYAEVTSC